METVGLPLLVAAGNPTFGCGFRKPWLGRTFLREKNFRAMNERLARENTAVTDFPRKLKSPDPV